MFNLNWIISISAQNGEKTDQYDENEMEKQKY